MLSAKRAVLRPWSEADLPLLSGIRNDIGLQLLLMAEPKPNPEGRVRQWLQDPSAQPDGVFFVIARADNDQAAGFIQVQRIDRRNRTGYLGICLAPGHQGEVLGADALKLLEAYLRGLLDLCKILLEVPCENQGAIDFYRLAGVAGLSMNPKPPGTANGAWMPTAVLSPESGVTREPFQKAVAAANIDARVFFWPLTATPLIGGAAMNPVAASIAGRAISLPSFHDMTDEDLDRVCGVLITPSRNQ